MLVQLFKFSLFNFLDDGWKRELNWLNWTEKPYGYVVSDLWLPCDRIAKQIYRHKHPHPHTHSQYHVITHAGLKIERMSVEWYCFHQHHSDPEKYIKSINVDVEWNACASATASASVCKCVCIFYSLLCKYVRQFYAFPARTVHIHTYRFISSRKISKR